MKYAKLCAPSILFLIVTFLSLVITIFQNMRFQILVMKIIYLLVGYWLLDYLCLKRLTWVSWILVLFSFFMMFR